MPNFIPVLKPEDEYALLNNVNICSNDRNDDG